MKLTELLEDQADDWLSEIEEEIDKKARLIARFPKLASVVKMEVDTYLTDSGGCNRIGEMAPVEIGVEFIVKIKQGEDFSDADLSNLQNRLPVDIMLKSTKDQVDVDWEFIEKKRIKGMLLGLHSDPNKLKGLEKIAPEYKLEFQATISYPDVIIPDDEEEHGHRDL